MTPLSQSDRIRLRHMLDAGNEALEFARGRTREELTSDRMFALALVKLIEIIREAAARVSPEGRAAVAGIPWRDVVAMRNVLVHGYFDIDLDLVWDTATEDLPALVDALERTQLDTDS